jgi:hypothetical protein
VTTGESASVRTIPPAPATRILLLGASNLTLSFPLIVNTLRLSLAQPLEILAAHGHGRSFCQWSYVLNRGLPPIPQCGLWDELNRRSISSVQWALVADVGNDLIYGRSVEELLQQVQLTFQRLSALGAEITFVRMPLERVLKLTERQYRIVKQLLFPGPTIPWEVISRRAIDVDEQSAQLAREFNSHVITPRLHWYGADPIHIRRSARIEAWKEILATATRNQIPPIQMHRPSSRFALNLWRSPPLERTFHFGRTRHARYVNPQPSWSDPTGTTLWLY